MSHEIRTPLNAIVGMSHILLSRGNNLLPDQKKKLEIVIRSSDHLLAIINDILDFSKIESEKLELENVAFNLPSLIKDTVETFVMDRESKPIQLIQQIESYPCMVLGDPTRIKQMLLNYLSNAFKFTQFGHITINMSVIDEDLSNVMIKVEVKDTGMGISEETMNSLFLRFSQADTTTTRRFGGTGLGLAINSKLAALMQGSVGVDSLEGVGSTFWFTMKLRKVNSASSKDVEQNLTASPLKTLQRQFKGTKILIAEDDEFNRLVLEETLADIEFEIHFACDGMEAVEKAKHQDYALILMDMQMPVMDGIEATKAIKHLQFWR
jgi:signal transduction histidine kinase